MISRISAEIFRFCPLLRNESHDLTFMNVPPPLGLLFRGGWYAGKSPGGGELAARAGSQRRVVPCHWEPGVLLVQPLEELFAKLLDSLALISE